MEGKVKWFSKEKGHGYIFVENDKDHFFNVSDVIGLELPENGDTVGFDSGDDEKGKHAYSVEILCKPLPGINGIPIDYRVTCTYCGRKMTPRQLTQRGYVRTSICPYCQCNYGKQSKGLDFFSLISYVILFFLALIFLGGVFSSK